MDVLVTYSVLSLIQERKSNLKSLIEVYQDLCESILADDSFGTSGAGVITDLKTAFRQKFELNVPYPTLKILLSQVRSNHTSSFSLHRDYSFQFDPHEFDSLRKDIETEKEKTQELRDFYSELCKDEGIEKPLDIDFFVEINKRHLLAYMNREEYSVPDRPEYEVIKALSSVPEFRRRIERLLLGALISSYMDLDIEHGMGPKTLVLDTNFIVSVFDLHSEQSYDTCKEIMDTANRFSFGVEVLDATIQETKNLLRRKAFLITEVPLFSAQDQQSIEHGCYRRRLSGADLFLYENKVEKLLRGYGVKVVRKQATRDIENNIENSDIYQKLVQRNFNQEGAKHDAIAMEYVKRLRKGSDTGFQDTKAFFVTDSHGYMENKLTQNSKLPYIIRAEELLNVLWLLNPTSGSTITHIMISRVFSMFLEQRVPDKEMLSKLDRKISALEGLPIEPEDCRDIVVNLSLLDGKQLQELIDIEDGDRLRSAVADLAVKARNEAIQERKQAEEKVAKIVSLYEAKYTSKLDEISEQSQQKLKELGKEKDSLEREIRTEREEKDRLVDGVSTQRLAERAKNLQEFIKRDKEELSRLDLSAHEFRARIDRRRNTVVLALILLISVLGSIIAIQFVVPNWSWVEPVFFVVTPVSTLALVLLSSIERTLNPVRLVERLTTRLARRVKESLNEAESRMDVLRARIEKAELEFNDIIV